MKKIQIYLAGDMLQKGSRMLRELEKRELEKIEGVEVYSPKDDNEINDKKNISEADNNNLAERIVYKDTKAIIESDVIIIEPQNNALGTMVELGQIKGMKDSYLMIRNYIYKTYGKEGLENFRNEFEPKFVKPVFPHYEDARRTQIFEIGDRRSFSINQYVYGVCLDLCEEKTLLEWEEILNRVCNYVKEIKDE